MEPAKSDEPYASYIEEDIKCPDCGFIYKDIRCPMCASHEVAVSKKKNSTRYYVLVCTRCESISTIQLEHIDGHHPPAEATP